MSFICPFPLAYGVETDHKTVWVYEEGNCALRCPTITYTQQEWNLVGNVTELLFSLSLAGSCIILIYHVYTFNMKAEFLPRIMFILGFFMVSLILVIFLSLNGHDYGRLTCDGQSAFVEGEGLCVFQATSTIFFIIWIEMWSFFMAYENYLFISSALQHSRSLSSNNKKYLASSIFVCTSCALIPFYLGILGLIIKQICPSAYSLCRITGTICGDSWLLPLRFSLCCVSYIH